MVDCCFTHGKPEEKGEEAYAGGGCIKVLENYEFILKSNINECCNNDNNRFHISVMRRLGWRNSSVIMPARVVGRCGQNFSGGFLSPTPLLFV